MKANTIKVKILKNCTVCGFCVDACPDVFAICDGKVIVLSQSLPAKMNYLIKDVVRECPVRAIVKL